MSLNSKGFGPGSSYRFTSFRHGSLDGRNSNFRYPSQWWDVAHMELPSSVRKLFKWCRYHVLVNPLVGSAVKKMAAYPITKVLVDDRSDEGFDRNRQRWEDLLYRTIDVNNLQIEIGLDYHTYGNCIVSIFYPFHKHLVCRNCGAKHRIKRLQYRKEWDFKNFDYTMKCPSCGHNGKAKVEDVFYKSYKDIRIIRWNPSDMSIDYNPITKVSEYAYSIPSSVRKKVFQKKLSYLEELPSKFIEAMKKRRPVVLSRENIFHFKAATPSLASNDEGWGYPPILPALKDSFYLQIMKKAQEAVMLEHLVPLDIIFPSTQDQAANPYTTVNLSDWKRKIETELGTWRMDPNHKPILPLPVGYQRIGGNGRALMLTQEIRAMSEHIVVGMGVPQEFVFGGLSWTGSSVSLRMLENMFMTYRDMHDHFLKHFLVPNVSRFMGWSDVNVHMKEFKMADDIQNKQLLLSLNQMKKVSDQTLLSEFDKDAFSEMRLIEQELRRTLEVTKLDTLYKARIQGESQQVMMRSQTEAMVEQQKAKLRAQKELSEEQKRLGIPQQGAPPQGGPPGGPPQMPPQQGGPNQSPIPGQGEENTVNVLHLAEAWAKKLSNMDPVRSQGLLQQMSEQSPNLHKVVLEKIQMIKSLDQKPLPEKRPPRRAAGVI